MERIGKYIRTVLVMIVLIIIAWAFFDYGRRYYEHYQALKDRPIELTVLHWGVPAEDAIVDRLVKAFEADNKDVHIVRINAGDPGAFGNKLKTMMSASTPPDVFYLPPSLLPELAKLKLIAAMDEQIAKEPQSWREDFYPIVLNAFKYDTQTGLIGQGQQFALPKDFTTAVFYANTDLLNQAGVDWRRIQKNGWTWDEFEQEMQKVRNLNGKPGYAGREIFGTLLQIWPDTLRNVLWTYEADFFQKRADGTIDFAKLGLTDPNAQKGLELIKRMRLDTRVAFNASGIAKDGGQEFRNGNIGCTGPIGRWEVPRFTNITIFKWDVLPVPKGTTHASQIFYTGWAMSSRSKHPDVSYKLIRFLCGIEGQIQQAREGLAIPALKSVAESKDFLSPDGIPAHNSQAFLDAIPLARLAQLPRQNEFGSILEQGINRAIQTGQVLPTEAANDVQQEWTRELNSPLRQKEWGKMPWTKILIASAAILATLVTLLWIKAQREKLGPIERATERAGFAFIAPWIIGFLFLTLGPMIVSLLLSFTRWTGLNPLSEAEYVGIANFHQIVSYDPTFYQSIRVTVYFVLLGVPVSQIAALIIAMLMNTRVRGITFFRTVYFVPSVVSGVALAVLWLQLFNNDYGLINSVLKPFANLLGTNPPNWFGVDTNVPAGEKPVNDAMRWAIPAFVIMGLWGVGGGMIIYLAGLKGIPVSLYEAARIDGASALRQIFTITIPMLSPLIFYNLVMGIIGSFQVFTQAYTMTGAGPDNATLFYVLQLYRQAFEFHNMGYASALAWILFLLVLFLTVLVFKGSKNLVYYEGLR